MNTNHEVDRIVQDWLEDRVVTPRLDGLNEALSQVPKTPQTRARFLGRWFERGRRARRGAEAHEHPPETIRRNRIMLSATGVTAAIAILALSVSVLDPTPAPPSAGGASHVVAADGSGDFSSISEAVEAAAAGDVIMVAPGTYPEMVFVDKDLTILGDTDDPAEVVVHIPGDGEKRQWGSMPIHYGFWLDGADLEVANLTIRGPDAKVSAFAATSGNLVVHDVVEDLDEATDWPYGFLYMRGDATGELFDNETKAFFWIHDSASPTIRDNRIRDVIQVDGASTATISGNEIGAIWIRSSAAPIIETNVIDYAQGGGGFSSCGVQAQDPGIRPTLVQNTIRNAPAGICVGSGSVGQIADHVLEDNDVGISLNRSDVPVSGNVITGGGAGIVVLSVGSPEITGNTIDVTGRGIAVARGSSPIISDNEICAGEISIHVDAEASPEIGENATC